ncbi:hypothetical protein MVES_000152 [Malassezia vespertilionis]|uniref:Uncharacterized protein n=1 Tax=Malassezia vespertilionis TaxID=2020962 RepID=A0A2N1JHH5_9BASI|nr:hypothetical protein MVES_000152 [Malassezia vespertilionis]
MDASLFVHKITMRRADALPVLCGMMHTICFLRLLGTVTPSSATVGGVELPRIGDETIVQQLDDTCTDILARLDQETKKQGAADLDVGIGWHKPPDIAPISRPSSRSSDHRRISQQPTQSPYSWITSAFVGNRVGQNARAQTHQKILTKDPMQDVLKPAFEYWVVQLHIDFLPSYVRTISS